MQDPAQRVPATLDDHTIVVGSDTAENTLAALDQTIVVSSHPIAPSDEQRDLTHVAFVKKVQERARARTAETQSDAPTDQQTKPKDKRKRAFFSPVITRVLSRNILSQKDAISASLRARDQGITFLSALAQISALSGDEAL